MTQDLTLLLRSTLTRVCQCGHLESVHKKGEDRQGCYSCECQEYRQRLSIVRDTSGDVVARITTINHSA